MVLKVTACDNADISQPETIFAAAELALESVRLYTHAVVVAALAWRFMGSSGAFRAFQDHFRPCWSNSRILSLVYNVP